MAVTDWTEDRSTHEPAGTWGSMPANFGGGVEAHTANIPPYDPTVDPISTEFWQEQGRPAGYVGYHTPQLPVPYVNTAYPGSGIPEINP